MRNECFLDTNVLIYAASKRIDAPRKHDIARALFADTAFCTSGQVLAEFVANRRKLSGMSLTDLSVWIDKITAFPMAEIDAAIVRSGLQMSERYKISYWDGAILAAAEQLGAPIVYSEDLNDGQTYGSVKVINPFKVN